MELSRDEHNKSAKIENLIWEIAKLNQPNSYIDPKKIQASKEILLKFLND